MSIVLISTLILIVLLIYFNFCKNDLYKILIIDNYLKDIDLIVDKSIIDDALFALLTIYKAELSRSDTGRWVNNQKFDKLDNKYKVLPKLIQLGYIVNISDKSPLYIITYDGMSLIEFNNIFFIYTKKLKSLFIIKFLLTLSINKNTPNEIDAVKILYNNIKR